MNTGRTPPLFCPRAEAADEGDELHGEAHLGGPEPAEITPRENALAEVAPQAKVLRPVAGRDERQDRMVIGRAENVDDSRSGRRLGSLAGAAGQFGAVAGPGALAPVPDVAFFAGEQVQERAPVAGVAGRHAGREQVLVEE